jgi:hypothetical protein
VRFGWFGYVVHEQSERRVRFFAVELEKLFEFRPGWYRRGVVRAVVVAYYAVVRAVLRRRPQVRRCLTRCRHCRIFFIAHPRNAGRHDLGCPFGCQQAHRRRQSMQRVAAYYGDEHGKVKKRIQNGKRAAAKAAAAVEAAGSEAGPSETMVKHVQRVLSAIEGRRVSREEVLALLLRQRSMGKSAAGGYDAARPDERPP